MHITTYRVLLTYKRKGRGEAKRSFIDKKREEKEIEGGNEGKEPDVLG